jgi:hypothetical protein
MRIPIEGKIGEGKRCYTLDRLCTKLKETSETAIMMSFIVMNLARFSISFAAAQLSAAGIFLHSESEFPKRVKISILKIFDDDKKEI